MRRGIGEFAVLLSSGVGELCSAISCILETCLISSVFDSEAYLFEHLAGLRSNSFVVGFQRVVDVVASK